MLTKAALLVGFCFGAATMARAEYDDAPKSVRDALKSADFSGNAAKFSDAINKACGCKVKLTLDAKSLPDDKHVAAMKEIFQSAKDCAVSYCSDAPSKAEFCKKVKGVTAKYDKAHKDATLRDGTITAYSRQSDGSPRGMSADECKKLVGG